MSNPLQLRNKLKQRIRKNFTEDMFDRSVAYDIELTKDFDSYKDFLKHQDEIIDNLTESDLKNYYKIILLIHEEKIDMIDEEYMSPWTAYSYVFNPKNNNLALIHPQ